MTRTRTIPHSRLIGTYGDGPDDPRGHAVSVVSPASEGPRALFRLALYRGERDYLAVRLTPAKAREIAEQLIAHADSLED
jgi:hypothetical protein